MAMALGISGCQKSADSAPSSAPSSAVAALDLPDPRSLSGVSEVEALPDPQVIEGDFEQVLPAQVTDEEGNQVTVSSTERIVPLDLYGTISRTVIALGYGDHIVGRTVSSTENQLANLPVVTENGHSINVEAVLSLKPTVIIADRSVGPPEALDQLRAAGVPLVLINPHRSLDSNAKLIASVAAALGADKAGEALNERVEQEISTARQQIAAWAPEKPLDIAFLYVRGSGGIFFILGSEDGATELIEAVGGRDMASANNISGVTPATAESLVTLDPEVIFVMKDGLESTGGLEGFLNRPGVNQTRAGAKQRLIAIPDGVSLAFGPQSADIITAVARALYGVSE